MRRCRQIISALAMAAVLGITTIAAQEATTATLGLSEALGQAHSNNPLYRQRLNNAATARWQVRNAYGQLLPSVSASGTADYTGAGQVNFGQGLTSPTSAIISSGYSLGLSWTLDGSRILGPREQKANARAIDEEIASEESSLKFSVTQQYLTVLQATAQVAVSRQQVERNQSFLDLANAKYRVGQGTLIEVRQAEVQKAQADVALLRSVQAENEAKLELFRRIGSPAPLPVQQIVLSDSFPVTEPDFDVNALLTQAESGNPALRALRARSRAAATGVTSAKTAYLPSLLMRAGWSGFTQQQTDKGLLLGQAQSNALGAAASCFTQDSVRVGAGLAPLAPGNACYDAYQLDPNSLQLTAAARRQVLDQNNTFPFHFTAQPFSASLTISLPIFTGFGRSLRLQQAREFSQDADESVRAQVLQLQTDVQSRTLALQTAYRAIAVQAQSRDAARDQLRLAQDRYRLGSGTALEVSDAQNSVQRAEGDYVNSIYDYHKALAALEAAVGRPLRP